MNSHERLDYAVKLSQQTYEVSRQSPLPHLYSLLTIHDLIAPWCLRGSAARRNFLKYLLLPQDIVTKIVQ